MFSNERGSLTCAIKAQVNMPLIFFMGHVNLCP